MRTPDNMASDATQQRGQNMTAATAAAGRAQSASQFAATQAREANAGATSAGKAPPGYRFKADGSLESIPGGPADIKAGEAGAKNEQKRQGQIQGAKAVQETIRSARELAGYSTAGVAGLASTLPASDARDLAGKLETIKSNLGFDRLQQMRDSSPTGGALGAVAVQELIALQSTVASLDQRQSVPQLKANLEKVDKHYSNWLAVMEGKDPTKSAAAPADAGGLSPAESAELEALRKQLGRK